MSGIAGDAEGFGEFADGEVVQLVVFDESFTLFADDNNSQGHLRHFVSAESVTHVLRQCVTYVFRTFCYLCTRTVQRFDYATSAAIPIRSGGTKSTKGRLSPRYMKRGNQIAVQPIDAHPSQEGSIPVCRIAHP